MKNTFTKERYREFFEAHYPSLRSFIYYKIGDMDAAEDLAQEAFIKLWEKRDVLKMETVKSYLFTIGANLSINYGKHQQVKFHYQNTTPQKRQSSENPQYLLELKEFDALFQKAVNELPEELRITFLLHRVEKLKHREIAVRLGLSEKGVQKRLKKALEKLNQRIKYPL